MFAINFDTLAGINADIIRQLQKEILPLQGFKAIKAENTCIGLGAVEKSFPNEAFPVGALHECMSTSRENLAATAGFIAAIQATLMKNNGPAIWISRERLVFPPALKAFGIHPERMIFITLPKEKDMLWAMEECLKCEGLSAVTGEIASIDFKASRRLQLAVEQSRVTGFILRNHPRFVNPIASVARWKITAAASEMEDGVPGVGQPRWNVELLKARNGKPGQWDITWAGNQFNIIEPEKRTVWLNALPQYGSAI